MEQKSDISDIRQLSSNLEAISAAMVGGLEMSVLVQRIVDKIAEVLGADASSLYLLDPDGQILRIQAATGYQKILVEKNAKYYINEKGVTPWIARKGKSFKANSIKELQKHPEWAGKQNIHQGNREPNAFLGIPLKVIGQGGSKEVIGVLKVEDIRPNSGHPESHFTEQDELLVEMMGNVITTVIQNTRLSDKRVHELNTNLQKLSAAMVGGLEMSVLVQRIVDKIAEVLGADASSLYLIDGRTLKIQAAAGYQNILVKKGAFYDIDEKGVTPWIAREGKSFKAKSTKELEKHPAWSGKQNIHQDNRQPNSFLGIPLQVTVEGGRQEVIGVLKVEDIQPSSRHPESYFTEQDELLVEMMGNVITTVIQNTRVSEKRLLELNANLQALSTAMVGGLEMAVLVQRIVDKIAEVLGADASSLYLLDPDGQILRILAATGYQRKLVEKGAFYHINEKGITPWIAREGKSFNANNTKELEKHPAWAGKLDKAQGNRQPNAFLGIPLVVITGSGQREVIGVLKVEDIRMSSMHLEPYFTEQDELLVEMMGNIITTVIQNTRLSDNRMVNLLTQVFSRALPVESNSMFLEIFSPFVVKKDVSVFKALSNALLSTKPQSYGVLENQTRALLSIKADSELFRIMGTSSKDEKTARWYSRLYQLSQYPDIDSEKIPDALVFEQSWTSAMNASAKNKEDFRLAIEKISAIIAETCEGRSNWIGENGKWMAFELQQVLPASDIRLPRNIPIIFFQGPQWQSQEDKDTLRDLLNKKRVSNIILMIFLSKENMEKSADDLRQFTKSYVKDIIVLPLEKIQLLIIAKNSQKLLRSQLLEKVNLLTVSPYQISGPIPENMFFGRETELRQITDNALTTNYMIFGGRKIGKTSILKKLQRVNLPNKNIRSFYLDCSFTPTEAEIVKAVTTDPNWFPAKCESSIVSFDDVIKKLPHDKPIVILLDEFDKLITDNTDYKLFSLLRASSNSEFCKFVISGERTLLSEIKRPDKPLYNFAEKMIIGLLDEDSVKELITSPMKQMEIEIVNEVEFVEKIWKFTSGHPNIVQRLCDKLIKGLNKSGNRRLTTDDVESIITDQDFLDENFFNIFWERATTLERLCSLVMAYDRNARTLTSVQTALQRNGVIVDLNEVFDALERLVNLRNILKKTNEGYEFSVTVFPEIISKTKRFKDHISRYRETFQKHGDIIGEVV